MIDASVEEVGVGDYKSGVKKNNPVPKLARGHAQDLCTGSDGILRQSRAFCKSSWRVTPFSFAISSTT